jgi:alanine racemase
MEKCPHPTWIEVDLAQFQRNLIAIRKHIGKSRLCLPVKANAYGHGLIAISKAAENLVDCLAVSCLQEGVALREAGISSPILVLGAIHEDQVETLIHHELEFSISSKFKADLIPQKPGRKYRIHLEVETGMQRTGVRCSTALTLIEHLKTLPSFEIVGVYSHLATASQPMDPFAIQQILAFKELIRSPPFLAVLLRPPHPPRTLLNSLRPPYTDPCK